MSAGTAPSGGVPVYRHNAGVGGTHELLLDLVPPGSSVLDVGCAAGYLGRPLVQRGCRVWGIEADAAAVASGSDAGYQDLRCADLDELAALPWEQEFDVVLAADVLEHVRFPERVLRMLVGTLGPGGRVVVSLPNVAHLSVRAGLALGRFRYTETGILDRTHLHFYTFATARELVEACGLEVEAELAGSDRFGRPLGRFPRAGRLLRGLLAYNIVLVARPAVPPPPPLA